jgi:hypothetical protein
MKSPTISTDKTRLLAAAVMREQGWSDGKTSGGRVCFLEALAVADERGAHRWSLTPIPHSLLKVLHSRYPEIDTGYTNFPTGAVVVANDQFCGYLNP